MKKILQLAGYVLIALVTIFVLISLLLQLPAVQTYVAQKATSMLSEQTGAEITIGKVAIRLPDEVHIKDIYLEDLQQDTIIYAGQLKADISIFSILRQKVTIDEVILKNAVVKMKQDEHEHFNFQYLIDAFTTDTSKAKDTTASGWVFSIYAAGLENVRANLDLPGIAVGGSIGSFYAEASDFDLEKQLIDLEQVNLKNSHVSVQMLKTDTLTKVETGPLESEMQFLLPELGWSITCEELQFSDNNFAYHDDGQALQTHGLDPAHLELTDLNLSVADISYIGNVVKADIESATLYNKTGGTLQELQGSILLDKTSINLDDLSIKFNDSQIAIAKEAVLSFPDVNALSELSEEVGINITLKESHIASADLLYLIPALESLESINLQSVDMIRLEGSISGTVGSLSSSNFICSLGNEANLQMAFQVTDLQEIGAAIFKLDIQELTVQPPFLASLLNMEFPQELYRFGKTKLKGSYLGTLRDMNFDGSILSDVGRLSPKLHACFNSDYSNASYEGKVVLDNLELGTILEDTTIGDVSLSAEISGEGLSLEQLHAELKTEIKEASFIKYNYRDINIDGRFDQKKFTGNASVHDENIYVDFDGFINLNEDIPEFGFEASVDTLNFLALNLTDYSLFVHGNMKGNFKANSLDDFTGYASATNFLIGNDSLRSSMDSIVVTAVTENDIKSLQLQSPIIHAKLDGDFRIADLPALLYNYLNPYLPSEQKFTTDSINTDQEFELIAAISKPLETARIFLPKLSEWDTASIKATFDGKMKAFDMEVQVPAFAYDSVEFSEISLMSAGDGDSLSILTAIKSINYKDQLNFPITSLRAIAFDEMVNMDIAIEDDSTKLLGIAVGISGRSDSTIRVILDRTLIINNEAWLVSGDHYLAYDHGSVYVHQLDLSAGTQKISIQSQQDQEDHVNIEFTNFDLREISDLAGLYFNLDGNVNGDFDLRDISQNPTYSADINVTDIAFDRNEVGDLHLKATPSGKDIILNAGLTDDENNLLVSGSIKPESQSMDLSIDVQRLNLSIADPFLSAYISDSKGYFSSELKVSGEIDNPGISGNIGLHDISTFAVYPNSRYSFKDNLIKISSDKIQVDNLEALDPQNRKIKLNGFVRHDQFSNFKFNFNIDSKEFLFMNTDNKDDLLYGTILLGVNANLLGTPKLPIINAVVSTKPGTRVFLLPAMQEESLKQEDFVLFQSPPFDNPEDDSLIVMAAQYEPRISGIDLNLDFQLTPDAELQLIIDPFAGDQLTCKGTANLSVKIPPAGTPKVNGSYIVESGNYSFTYQRILKKEFDIVQGSRIDFSGEVMDAQLDITTAYNARASTYELIAAESVSLNASELSAAKRRVPVKVILNIRGEIERPELTYDIRFADNTGNVTSSAAERKLIQLRQDQAELSKQVFALLLFNSFIADYGTGGTDWGMAGTNLALQSVSSMITNQFSKLSAINEGFEVNLDLTSYQEQFSNSSSSDNITEMGLDISQKFLNDRLEVSVGGNVNFDNSASGQSRDASNITGDFAVEYKLTENGNYRVKIFRTGNFDMVNQSNIYRTGVGFTYHQRFGGLMPGKKDQKKTSEDK